MVEKTASDSFSDMNKALEDAREALNDLRYHSAVLRDNQLSQAELIPYLEGRIWAEERGLL